jgi:hypothetical protein
MVAEPFGIAGLKHCLTGLNPANVTKIPCGSKRGSIPLLAFLGRMPYGLGDGGHPFSDCNIVNEAGTPAIHHLTNYGRGRPAWRLSSNRRLKTNI